MFKARMKFVKDNRAKYISHLDLMRTMQRSMARCEMPLWFTEGFNKHAYVSIALPLATGHSGECEFLDFNLLTESVPKDAVSRLNAVFPAGLLALEIYPLSDGGMKVAEIAWSRYRITWRFDDAVPETFCDDVQELFARDCVEVLKRSKRTEKLVNMRTLMHGQPRISCQQGTVVCETITGAGNNNMSPEYLTRAIRQYLPEYTIANEAYHREYVYTKDLTPFR